MHFDECYLLQISKNWICVKKYQIIDLNLKYYQIKWEIKLKIVLQATLKSVTKVTDIQLYFYYYLIVTILWEFKWKQQLFLLFKLYKKYFLLWNIMESKFEYN